MGFIDPSTLAVLVFECSRLELRKVGHTARHHRPVAFEFKVLFEVCRRPEGRRWSGQEIDEGAFSEAARECAKKMCRLADAPADSGAYSTVVH